MSTIHQTIDLETESCCACGVIFAMPALVMRERRTNGGSFYCPNGHGQHYSKSKIEELREQLSQVQTDLTRAKCQMIVETNRRIAIESNFNRQQKRIKNGVCPCCHRTFRKLAAHMKSKHPSFSDREVKKEEGK